MNKIAVIGTHSVGKSTLCYQLAYQYKLLGESVHIVQERVRFSPCPINQQMTQETLIWVCTNQISKEIEAQQRGFSLIITDRSPLDTFAYGRYNSIPIPLDLEAYAKKWLSSYSKIFFVRPDQTHTPFNDGIRSTDLQFIHQVDSILSALIEDVPNIQIITTSEIFKNDI